MPGPYNPLMQKTYNPNDEYWDTLAQVYEDVESTSDRQNESEKED